MKEKVVRNYKSGTWGYWLFYHGKNEKWFSHPKWFGFNYISTLSSAEIYVVNDVDTDEQDLIQDFISFCARIYGKRRSKQVIEKVLKELG